MDGRGGGLIVNGSQICVYGKWEIIYMCLGEMRIRKMWNERFRFTLDFTVRRFSEKTNEKNRKL